MPPHRLQHLLCSWLCEWCECVQVHQSAVVSIIVILLYGIVALNRLCKLHMRCGVLSSTAKTSCFEQNNSPSERRVWSGRGRKCRQTTAQPQEQQGNLHIYRKKIINTNISQITALYSSNNTLDALPTTWKWKNISELRHQALHPTETSPTHMPIRRTMGPIRVPFRQAKRTRAIMECQN